MTLAEPIPLPCPHCGYDLRGGGSTVCPECGEAFDPAVLATAAIPWQNRRDVGRLRAFRRTAWLAVRRPGELARQAPRPVDYADARRFQLLCVTLAWLTVAPPAAWGAWTALRGLPGFVLGPAAMSSTWAGRLADGSIVLAAVAGLFAWLLTASGVAGYFFHPRRLDAEVQNRAVALSYYSAAPLALLPLVGVLVLALGTLMGWLGDHYGAPTLQNNASAFLLFAVLCLCLGVLGLLVVLELLILPLTLLGRGTHASVWRVASCGATLLVAWPLLFVIFAVGPPVLVFYVQLAWNALT